MNDILSNWRTTAFIFVKAKYSLVFSAEDVAIIGFALGSVGSSVSK